jgi:hypothetical protein
MSIAELIMQGTQRSSESTAWVGDSLAKLGESVGKALQEREQQKQAQEMLPFLQQSMQESMNLAQSGDTAGAYSNMMGIFASNPNLLQNKAALPFLEIGLKGINESSKSFLDSERLRVQENRYNQPDQTDMGFPVPDEMLEGQLPQEGMPQNDLARFAQAGAEGRPFPQISAAQQQGIPASQPLQGTPEQQQQQLEDQIVLPGEQTPLAPGPVNVPKSGVPVDWKPPEKTLKKFLTIADRINAMDEAEKIVEMDDTSVTFPTGQKANEYISKASKDKQVFNLNPDLYIGVPGAIGVELPKEVAKNIVTQNIGARGQSFSIREGVEGTDDENEAIKWLEDWQKASMKVSSSPMLTRLLSSANGNVLNIKMDEADQPVQPTRAIRPEDKTGQAYTATIVGNKDFKQNISKDQRDDILILQNQTAAAQTNKAKFIRLKTAAQPKAATAKKLSPMDQQALDWANANSNDPRANQIKQRLGI